MKLKQLMDFEMDKNKKSSLQVKAVKALAGFLILMFLLTILSRAADSLTIAKVTASAATGGVISHNIEVDGNITPNKDIAISTSANIKIASVEATEGNNVKKGDLLIQLDTADLKKKLLQAQKELQVAKATASDKKANEAIAADTKSKSLQRSYEDYNLTVADANGSVSKAKSDMNEAWNAYNTYKNSNSNSGETDTTVSDSLEKTVEEKQLAYDKAVANLDGVEKDIEADEAKWVILSYQLGIAVFRHPYLTMNKYKTVMMMPIPNMSKLKDTLATIILLASLKTLSFSANRST